MKNKKKKMTPQEFDKFVDSLSEKYADPECSLTKALLEERLEERRKEARKTAGMYAGTDYWTPEEFEKWREEMTKISWDRIDEMYKDCDNSDDAEDNQKDK
jgi:hypothetical protein